MTVKKKTSTAIESFIDKGADVKAKKEKSFKNVLIRVPTELLDQIEYSLEIKSWMTRTQWIVEAIDEKVRMEFDE